jgi:hypothetical protein
MIESKCPKCEKHFRSELFDSSSRFKDKDKFNYWYITHARDFSQDNKLREGYVLRCHHCNQIFEIKFDPVQDEKEK